MNKLLAVLVFSWVLPGLATTYTVSAGSSAGTIQSILNTAGSSPGNTVLFSAGTYTLGAALNLPCSNGTIYTGPNVGVVTQSNLPTAILTSTVPTDYALSTNSNGTTFTGSQGCTIQYLRFSGTQGGILVCYPRPESSFRTTPSIATILRPAETAPNRTYGLPARIGASPQPTECSIFQSYGICFSTTVPRFARRLP